MTTINRPWSPGQPLPAGLSVLGGGIDPAFRGAGADKRPGGDAPASPVRALSTYQRGYVEGRRHAARQLVPLIAACLDQMQACRRLRNGVSREDPTYRTHHLLADAYRGEAKRLLSLRRALLEDPYR